MTPDWHRYGIGVALACIALSGCHSAREVTSGSLPYYADATFTPRWIEESAPELEQIPRVGSFALVDQRGEEITEAVFTGRVGVVNFFYTHCGDICPLTTARLQAIATHFADDARVVLLSHTVTPESDSVSQLADYAMAKGIGAGQWHLLTGPDTTLQRLAHSVYHLLPAGAESWGVDSLSHTERVLLLDQRGRIRGVYNGTLALEMDHLRSDIARLLAEGR